MEASYRAACPLADLPMRICWVNPRERLLSFHEIAGYTQKRFSSRSEEWAFVHSRLDSGYRVQ